jgi:prophage antirepressor-like protein
MQIEHSPSGPGFLPARTGKALPDIELVEIDGEPRTRDTDVAERLGYERPRAIRQIIERNRDEIEAFGSLATRRGESRGQEYEEYWLTEEQALLVASRSDAPNAAQVRHLVIKVFVAWRRGHLVPALPTTAEAFASAFTMLAQQERRQAEQGQQIMAIEAKVAAVAETNLLKAKPQNAETISEIRKRINRIYGLPPRIIDTVMGRLTYSPKPAGMVKNSHENAEGSSFAVYWIRDVSQAFKFFVDECHKVTATQAVHPHIEGRFKLTGR